MKASSAVSYTSFLLAFAYFVLFNLFDLSSTILALRVGLTEANSALVYLSSLLGVGIAGVIVLAKSLFFAGAGGLLILGIISRNYKIKRTVLFTLIAFAAVFAIVSVNNFLNIYAVLDA
jgi:hypothetical protein